MAAWVNPKLRLEFNMAWTIKEEDSLIVEFTLVCAFLCGWRERNFQRPILYYRLYSIAVVEALH